MIHRSAFNSAHAIHRWTLRVAVIVCGLLAALMSCAENATAAIVHIHPGRVRNTISRGIYGQFLEHIYHSADNGVWGQLIWNRSFEQGNSNPGGNWSISGKEIRQLGNGADAIRTFGQVGWSNYEISLDAKKIGGNEGFLIQFYDHDAKHFFWLNLGGWGNTQDAIQQAQGKSLPTVIGGHPTIHIESGQWYHIRLRCRGPHIQVWVNARKLFDQTLAAGAHVHGKVGIGTWQTQAEFKHIRVTTIAGNKTLFSGLPQISVKPPQFSATFWSAYGNGIVFATTIDPRNSRRCIKVTSNGTEAGVKQDGICLRYAGEYRGSVWLRGNAPAGAIVRITAAHKVLYRKAISTLVRTWHRVALNFKATKPFPRVTLQIGVKGSGTVYVDEVSLMSQRAIRLGGFRPDTLAAIKALKPALIRWPGGGYADTYHWKNGIGPDVDRVSEWYIWNDTDPNDLGTDEYIQLCRLTGAAPEICINIGTGKDDEKTREQYIREACQWVEYCNSPVTNKWGQLRAKYGHPKPYHVKYWEIGNEVWYGSTFSAPQYIKALTEFTTAMKKVDPRIQFIACGSGGLNLKWNRDIIAGAATEFSYLGIHQYVGPYRYIDGAKAYLNFIRKTGDIIRKSANPHMKLFVSEWNEMTIDWRTGIFAGLILTGFERQGSVVGMASPALFLRWVGQNKNDWNNALINFSRRSWFPAPNYVVMKFWRDHFAKYRVAATAVKGLEADATISADHQIAYYKAVNLTGHPIHLTLKMGKGFPIAKARAGTVAPPSQRDANSMHHPARIGPKMLMIQVSGQQVTLTVARYSATIVTMRRAGK